MGQDGSEDTHTTCMSDGTCKVRTGAHSDHSVAVRTSVLIFRPAPYTNHLVPNNLKIHSMLDTHLTGRLVRRASNAVASSSRPKLSPLPHRSILEISGPDAQTFLKGLSCKDVESTRGGYSGFLNASVRSHPPPFPLPPPRPMND